MDYSIKPGEHELREARQEVENVLESYSFALDIENVEIELGWQRIERGSSLVSAGGSRITLVINPEKKLEELEKNVLRGLLEIEFLKKADYSRINYNWQEVAKFAYVKNRIKNLVDEQHQEDPELEENWESLRENLSREVTEFDEEFYMNAAQLGETIGRKLLEDHEVEDIPQLKKSNIVDTGDEFFR